MVKTLLYKVVKENVDRLNDKVQITNKELILQKIKEELHEYEESLA